MSNPLNLLNKLIAQQDEILSQEILSPVIQGSSIIVRINGVALSLRVNPKGFHGWGLFKYNGDHKSVTYSDEPSRRQKMEFLELLPRVRLIICSHNEKESIGSLLDSDGRFSFDAASVFFAENISLFDTIVARYDGKCFLYERHANYNPRKIDELKAAFADEIKPDKLNTFASLGRAYAYAYNEVIKAKELTIEQKVKQAINRAGGKYRGFTDRGETLTVQFTINGQTFTPTVNSKTLMLESAGICLSGGDRAFDLQSFVHIAREGLNRDSIVRGDYIRTYGDRSADYRR